MSFGRVRLQTGNDPFKLFTLDVGSVLRVDTRQETAIVHIDPSGVEGTDRVIFARTGETGDIVFKHNGVDVAKLPAPYAAWLEMRLDAKGGLESFRAGDGAVWSDEMQAIIAKRTEPEPDGFICDVGVCDETVLS